MSGDQVGGIFYIALLIVLVGSALLARRLPLAKSARMAFVWVAIFAVVILIFAAISGD